VKPYRLSPEAKQDLDEIFDYVAVHGNIAAADRVIDDITRHFPLLGNNPQLGRSREEIAPGTRSFPVGNYVIYYRRSKRGVKIARVLHGARDQYRAFVGDEQVQALVPPSFRPRV
jgi:toxin ParE1/3/4